MESEARILQKLDGLQRDFTDMREEMRVSFAELPSVYVSQESINEARAESRVAKRFAIASIIASIGALGTYVGIFVAAL